MAFLSLLSLRVSFFFLLCLIWKLNFVTFFLGDSPVFSVGIVRVLLFFAVLLPWRNPSNGDFLGDGLLLSKFLLEPGDVTVEAGDVTLTTDVGFPDDVTNCVSTSMVVGAWYPGFPSAHAKRRKGK